MDPKRFLYLGLLIAALMVASCGPKATPEPTSTPLPPTDTPMSAATEEATPVPTKAEGKAMGEVPMGFTEEGAPYRGDPKAPVTLLEYSDFQ